MRIDASIDSIFDLNTYLVLRSRADSCADIAEKWLLLQAAHIVGQATFSTHVDSHVLMLKLAWQTRDWSEIRGQLFRLSLVPLGHALGRLPFGNPGTSDVSAFQPMQVPLALKNRIAQAQPVQGKVPKFPS